MVRLPFLRWGAPLISFAGFLWDFFTSSSRTSSSCRTWLLPSWRRPFPSWCTGTFSFQLSACHFFLLFRAEIALALLRASALLDAPQACNDNSRRVGRPFSSRSGPGMLPIRARNDARRGLSPDFTGGFSVPPLYDARPLALSPPFGFLPSLRCHAGVLATTFRPRVVNEIRVRSTSLGCSPLGGRLLLFGQRFGFFVWVLFVPERCFLFHGHPLSMYPACHSTSNTPSDST